MRETSRGYVPPQQEVHKQPEEKKFDREVARIFLLKSRNHKDVYSDINALVTEDRGFAEVAGNYDFTGIILMEKGSESVENPGQVMPIGGNRDPHDTTIEKTVEREMLEETHLHPAELKNIGNFSYTHQEKKGTKVKYAHNYLARILPSDTAYPLNPQEDKVHTFHRFTLEELAELWGTGGIEKGGGHVDLQDALIPSPTRKKMLENGREEFPTKLTLEEEGKMWKTMGKLGLELRNAERWKKINIMHNIIDTLKFREDDVKKWLSEIFEAGDNHRLYTDVWKRFLQETEAQHGDSLKDAFFQAVEMSNFEEEVAYAGNSKLEAVTRFMYTLLELKHPLDIYIEKAKDNAKLADFSEKLQKFIKSLKEISPEISNHSQEYKNAFEIIDEYVEEFSEDEDELERIIRTEFARVFGPGESDKSPEIIGNRLERLNNFFERMGEEIRYLASESSLVEETRPTNEINSAGLVSLIQFSVPTRRAKEYFQEAKFSKKRQRAAVFEARRSVALLSLLGEFDEYYEQVTTLKNEPIERIWGGILSAPNDRLKLAKKMGNDGIESYEETLLGSEPAELSQEITGESDELKKKIKEDVVNMREYVNEEGMSYLVAVNTRKKGMDSFYRKAMVRGFDDPREIQDIFGRSIVVSSVGEGGEHAMEFSKRTLTSWKSKAVSEDGVEDSSREITQEYEDSPAVFDLIESYQRKAEERGAQIRILDYKSTPKPGEKIKSSGVGGGGDDVRFAKFYIELTDKQGVKRYEEVQVFTPTSKEHTGFYWEQKKKEDDNRYAIKRLLDTEGMRSFIELLWPHGIYGEIVREFHKKGVSEEARKKRQSVNGGKKV